MIIIALLSEANTECMQNLSNSPKRHGRQNTRPPPMCVMGLESRSHSGEQRHWVSVCLWVLTKRLHCQSQVCPVVLLDDGQRPLAGNRPHVSVHAAWFSLAHSPNMSAFISSPLGLCEAYTGIFMQRATSP